MSLTDFGLIIDKEKKFERLKPTVGEIEAVKVAFTPDKLEKVKINKSQLHKNELESVQLIIEDEEDMNFLRKQFFINSLNQIRESKEIIKILKEVKNA